MSNDKDRSGAESLVQTFVDAGVDVCFANPGTSEMHFVAALDTNPEMRCVLGLFEGIVTGAAWLRPHGPQAGGDFDTPGTRTREWPG